MTETLLASLLDTIPQPAILMDAEYRVVAANEAYQQRYQFTPGDTAVTCYQISHGYDQPCDRAGESCPLQAAVQSRKPERTMHIHNTPEGREHIDVHLEPIFDDCGELIYFLETLREVNRHSQAQGSARTTLKGESEAFNRMLLGLSQAADAKINVLLLGESGTGKELAARFLHENSSRRQKPFVTVECSGLSDTIFESELFGHVKGSFTGAINNKPGLIDSAEGGTLFLDEVGDIPLSQQVKLLRLIETGIFRPVGSVENRFADFRLVCATNRDLAAMVAAGEFREDLFYRINGFPVLLPPLRERRDDVLLLAKSLLRDLSGNLLLHFSEAAQDFLLGYAFPGNIRELRNLVERATLLCSGNRIELDHVLPPQLPPARPGPIGTDSWQTLGDNAIIPLQHLEARYLQHLDNTFSGGKSELAAKLGISERTLYRKLQKTSKQ